MNIVFWLLILLALVIIWIAIGFIFPYLGKLLYHIFKDTKYNLSHEYEIDETEESEEDKNV